MSSTEEQQRAVLIAGTTDITAAFLSRNAVPLADVQTIIQSVYSALSGLGSAPKEAPAAALQPAVPIRKSVTPDYIVCLEDGKRLKMLKRHLRTSYNLTPDEYRAKWGLPKDYPMTAPNYAASRSQFAKDAGLGRKKAAVLSAAPKAKKGTKNS